MVLPLLDPGTYLRHSQSEPGGVSYCVEPDDGGSDEELGSVVDGAV
jgi:hypothetical protein